VLTFIAFSGHTAFAGGFFLRIAEFAVAIGIVFFQHGGSAFAFGFFGCSPFSVAELSVAIGVEAFHHLLSAFTFGSVGPFRPFRPFRAVWALWSIRAVLSLRGSDQKGGKGDDTY
jgi:hypothetical protein